MSDNWIDNPDFEVTDDWPTQQPVPVWAAIQAQLDRRAARCTLEDFWPEQPPVAIHPSVWPPS